MDYINWYNNHRLHGSLDYLTPMEYKEKQSSLKDFRNKISCEFASILKDYFLVLSRASDSEFIYP